MHQQGWVVIPTGTCLLKGNHFLSFRGIWTNSTGHAYVEVRHGLCMAGTPLFTPDDTKEEVNRFEREAQDAIWESPSGHRFSLNIPFSVYPPREDTNLLASVLQRCRLPYGSSCLEIGCGSGALSLMASSLGWRVVACDVNPLAVAASRGHAQRHGLQIDVREGGPGPNIDSPASQWGGDGTYRIVMWNMPYLHLSNDMEASHLGPLEEASLTDTDEVGLFPRFVDRIASTNLLAKDGVALVVLSSSGDLQRAQAVAWRSGMAAREVETCEFSDGERLGVVALWHPHHGAERLFQPTTSSTNTALLDGGYPIGTSMRVDEQTSGRGRHQRSWSSSVGSLEASWVLADGMTVNHHPLHQVMFGEAIVHHLNQAFADATPRFCLKWPNDVYVRRLDSTWAKCGGILYEMASKGARHRLVVGLGLNATNPPDPVYGCLADVGLQRSVEQLAVEIDAIVASLHSQPKALESGVVERFAEAADACRHGVAALGPEVVEGQVTEHPALQRSGGLRVVLNGEHIDLDDSADLVWLGIQNGIHDV